MIILLKTTRKDGAALSDLGGIAEVQTYPECKCVVVIQNRKMSAHICIVIKIIASLVHSINTAQTGQVVL